MKNIYLLLICIFLGTISQAQIQLSLKDVISLAKTNSISSKKIENRYQNSYWRHFSYKRQFLPSLVFNGILPEFQHSISNVTQNDGAETFVNRNIILNKANLSINQLVPLTGGVISIGTGLDNIQLSGNTQSTTYLSRPIEFGYSQNIFGFNRNKWDKKIEPLYLNEAELLKTEGVVAGYKVGTFAKGEYDNGPVNGLSGPVTAVMFSKGIHDSGAHISIDCCNMSFIEADFAAVVGSDEINYAKTDMEVLAALSGFLPFIEMPDLLQPSEGSSNVGGIATNYDFRNAIIGNLIKTQSSAEWIKRLNNFQFVMTNEEGEILAEGSIKNAYDPLYRVRHLRNQLLKRGKKLKSGDLLSLGNMGAIRPLKPNLYFDPSIRPIFRGNIATVSYIGLDPAGPQTVEVVIDRSSK
jgi:2-keto-4-pentenoate hydratase